MATLWYNMFMIVSSHDFEEKEGKPDTHGLKDWGKFQIINSLDMSVIGNPYVDSFLTAGLGCHRVHHLLPYQRSAFANIICIPIVKEVCKDYGIEWKPTKNFLLDRLPSLYKFYLWSPLRRMGKILDENRSPITEAIDPRNFFFGFMVAIGGFLGMGAS